MSAIAFIPVKDASRWFPPFSEQLEHLKDVGQVIFSYGKSGDNTFEMLKTYKKHSKHAVRVKADPQMGQVLSSAQIGKVYFDLQRVMTENPDDYPESHLALLDADVMRIPPNLIPKLKAYDKDIVAPYVWVLYHDTPCKWFFDTMVFRYHGCKFHPYAPPRNNGKLLELDSVGTTILIKKPVFLDVPYGDPYPHMKFCDDARSKGYHVWADPDTAIYHVDLTRLGIFHYELDVLKAAHRGEQNIEKHTDPVPFIKDDGTKVNVRDLGMECEQLYMRGIIP